jgi:hypothetical protein
MIRNVRKLLPRITTSGYCISSVRAECYRIDTPNVNDDPDDAAHLPFGLNFTHMIGLNLQKTNILSGLNIP